MTQEDDVSFMNPKFIVKLGCYVVCGSAALCVLPLVVGLIGLAMFGHRP